MALAYLLDPNKQFQDRNGVNNVAGFLRVYYEGTDDRATTYKNFIGTLNPADIPIDNDGRAVVIVEDEKTYRLEVYARNGNLLWTQHPLCALVGGGGSFEQVQSNWDEDDPTSAAFIKNKPDLATVATSGSYNDLSDKPDMSQYIPASQKGAANGVGSLGSRGVQPYGEMYKGYSVEGDGVFKLCRILKTTTYSGGVSFAFVSRAYNKASGQILLWISPCEDEDSNVTYKVVNMFSRANNVTMQFFYKDVTVDSKSYVDVYFRLYGSSQTHVIPMWMRNGVQDMLSTSPVTLPEGAVEMTSRFFNVCAAKNGVGSALVPVYVNNAGDVVPCTMAPVASTGNYEDLLNKPDLTRVISSDGSDPMSAPPIAGITFINKSTHDIWYASGTTSASDWTLIYNRNHDLICQQKPIVISGSTTMRYILCDRQKYTIENGAYVFAPVDIYELAKWINRGDVIQIDGASANDPWGDRYPMRITEIQCSLDISTNKRYCTNIRCSGYTHVQTEVMRWGDNITDEATGTTYLEFQNWT